MLSGHVIQRSDIEVVPGHKGGSNTSLRLMIRHAKHQQVNRHVVLEIVSQSINCPVKLVYNYLHIRGSAMGPLFVFPGKSPMSRSYFATQLSACLSHAGYNQSLYKCHSFRVQVQQLQLLHGALHMSKFRQWADGNRLLFVVTSESQ